MRKIHSYELYTTMGLRDGKISYGYRVAPYVQPLHRWLISKVYHWYDMKIMKVPGHKALEALHAWWHIKIRREDPWDYMPLAVLQDLRCYDLARKDRIELRGFDISVEDYKKLGGQYAREEPTEVPG